MRGPERWIGGGGGGRKGYIYRKGAHCPISGGQGPLNLVIHGKRSHFTLMVTNTQGGQNTENVFKQSVLGSFESGSSAATWRWWLLRYDNSLSKKVWVGVSQVMTYRSKINPSMFSIQQSDPRFQSSLDELWFQMEQKRPQPMKSSQGKKEVLSSFSSSGSLTYFRGAHYWL